MPGDLSSDELLKRVKNNLKTAEELAKKLEFLMKEIHRLIRR